MKLLSAFVLVAGSLFASGAHAEVRSQVSAIQSVAFDGKILKVGYQRGGGCSNHKGDIELVLDASSAMVTANVVDIADKEDNCEALIYVEASVDVKEQAKALLKNKGVTLGQVKLVLPQITVQTW